MQLPVIAEWTPKSTVIKPPKSQSLDASKAAAIISLWDSRSPCSVAQFDTESGSLLIWDCRKFDKPVHKIYATYQTHLPHFCNDHFSLLSRNFRELFI